MLLIRRSALAGLTELELCMCWEEALVVGWALEIVFSSRLERSVSHFAPVERNKLNLQGQR